jgi:hypothetical protein
VRSYKKKKKKNPCILIQISNWKYTGTLDLRMDNRYGMNLIKVYNMHVVNITNETTLYD